MVSLMLFSIFFILLALGVPVAFAISLAGLGIVLYTGLPLAVFVQRMYTGLDSFPLMAIPLLMLAGTLMGHGGITKRIVDFSLTFIGNVRGSLAHVVAVSGIVLGSISGSGVANTAALGSILLPEMNERGYEKGFSAALVATSGINGLIIPPSLAIIIYAVTAGVSIGSMFMAALIPGVLIGVLVIVYSWWFARKYDYPREARATAKEKWQSFKKSIWALIMPILLIGGIYGGVFTPTEAGAVVSFYAFIIGMFVYREIKIKDIPIICIEAAISTATISLIVAGTSLFGWILTIEQIPQQISQLVLGITDNPVILLLIINAFMLLIGMFLDSGPKIMIFVPIFAPIAANLGMNLIQFGVIVVVNAAIGLLTPPVGTGLFVASSVSGVPIGKIVKSALPFFAIMFFVLMLVTFFPPLTMWVLS